MTTLPDPRQRRNPRAFWAYAALTFAAAAWLIAYVLGTWGTTFGQHPMTFLLDYFAVVCMQMVFGLHLCGRQAGGLGAASQIASALFIVAVVVKTCAIVVRQFGSRYSSPYDDWEVPFHLLSAFYVGCAGLPMYCAFFPKSGLAFATVPFPLD